MDPSRAPDDPVRVQVVLTREELLCRFLDDGHLLAVGLPDPRPVPPPRGPRDTRWQLRSLLDGSFEIWSLDPRRTHAPHRAVLWLTSEGDACQLELVPVRDRARGERLDGALGLALVVAWPIIDPFDFFASIAIGIGRIFVRAGQLLGLAPRTPAVLPASTTTPDPSLTQAKQHDEGPWRDSLMGLLARTVGSELAPQHEPAIAPFRALNPER